jgi:hypothetical protein
MIMILIYFLVIAKLLILLKKNFRKSVFGGYGKINELEICGAPAPPTPGGLQIGVYP